MDSALSRSKESRLRKRFLAAAVAIVKDAGGLAVAMRGLRFERVAKTAGVSQSSLYREWPTRHDFEVDLLCVLAREGWQRGSVEERHVMTAVRMVIADNLEHLDTPSDRNGVLEQVINSLVRASVPQSIGTNSAWRNRISMTALLLSLNGPDQIRVRRAIEDSRTLFAQAMGEFYQDIVGIVGRRLRDGHASYSAIATAITAYLDGWAMDSFLASDSVSPDRLDQSHWRSAETGVMQIFDALTLEDDVYDRGAAIAEYIKSLGAHLAG